jgi:signal transduction histidine kinase
MTGTENGSAGERERQRLMLQQMPGFVCLLAGPEHRYEYVNDAYIELSGPRDFLGRTVRAVFPELKGQGFFELLDRVYASGEPFSARAVQVRLEGDHGARFIDLLYQPVRDDSGAVTGIFVGGYDVTERVAAEARLRASEARLRALEELSDCLRTALRAEDIPHAAAEILGRALGVSRVGYGTIDDVAEVLHVERDWTAPGVETLAGDLRLRDYGSFIDSLRRDEFIAISDVREDARTAIAAAALEARSARSFVNVPVVEQGRLAAVLYVNHAEARNWRPEELTLVREIAARTREAVQRRLGEIALRDSEERYRMLFDAIDEGFCIIEFFDGPHGPLSDYVHVQANAAYTRHAGIPDVVGQKLREMVPDEADGWVEIYGTVLRTGEPVRFERELVKTGHYLELVAVRIEPPSRRQVAVLFQDITARKRTEVALRESEAHTRRQAAELANLNATLEQQVQERTAELMAAEESLRQSQKMEAVGQLTGGLAHDFNNLLAGISGSLEMMQGRIAQGRINDLDRYMIGAQSAAKRAAALTHRLLAFSRRQTLDPKPTDVNRLISGMEDLIRRTVGPAIEVETVTNAGLWPTLVDPNQLENALLNLCINARDAMPDGGRITIETANRWLDDRAARGRDLPAGQYISMCVSDNGTGMAPEIVEKAFDPFFTTKPIGVGTGLGLSMIYGFARQSGGQVRIYSESGFGTMVCIYLPRHHIGEATESAEPSEKIETAQAGETVLVIDDDALVRMLMVDVLEDLQYVALEASDGIEALKIIRSDARIDLLITDVGLPNGMNGRQVAEAARQARPGLKVLFVTGYAENAVLSHGHLDHGMQVVTKPFDMLSLASRIKSMIAER